ncbi:hypothetical protein TNCV_4138711 [Trichonephila clavipes]|nr:hypothetical protein TNCV_4138711 [Trichonephila clavipes]
MVPVAQWIARWTSNPKVVGSNPTRDEASMKEQFIFTVLRMDNTNKSQRVQLFVDHGSVIAMVTDSWPASHDFEPSATEDMPV